MKTYGRMSLMLLVLALAVSAQAAVTQYLPTSSHYEGKAYNPLYDVRIDFAVYDTQAYPEEFTLDVPGLNPGRYVYAYQIFNESDSETFSVDLFSLVGLGEGSIASADVIGSVDDDTDGIASTGEYFAPDMTKAYWEFEEGALIAGVHSWLLVLSSDNDWKVGSYAINPNPNNQLPVTGDGTNPPDENVPEPATMFLLGLGSVVFARRR